MTQERVNGTTWLAEPGSGLLFHPGNVLEGDTSEELEGLSILLPEGFQPPALPPAAPLLAAGLIASGVTSADYRLWCGESPRRTRRALGAAPAP
jgi:hypothetical protein